MKKNKAHIVASLILFAALACGISACGADSGGTGSGNPGNVALQYNPLSGSAAASLSPATFPFANWVDHLIPFAVAAVSSFTTFKMCNDTMVLTDTSGNTVSVNGETSQAGLGLLTFSPTSTTAQTLTTLSIATGVQIKEIKLTSAAKPSTCSGVTYAVQFDPGSGPINITQNTSFTFTLSTPLTISGSSQTLTLLLGQIVNGMVALGTGLNNSTIQTVNVGQAR
jgi:hypothetical protein